MDRLSGFESIPREILDLILDHLDQWTIPERNLRIQPSPAVFTTTPPATLSLKSLSLVSKSFRHAIIPRLFTHVRIVQIISTSAIANAEVHADPFSWVGVISDLASFLDRHALGRCVQSFTLRVEGFYPAYYTPSSSENRWILDIEKQWQNLFRLVSSSLRRLTILASPYCLGILLSLKLDPYINEALHMPYHLLVLEKPGLSPRTKDSGTTDSSVPSSISKLTDVKWTSLLLNEGSFLRYHADHTQHWLGQLLSTLEINGEYWFSRSFSQTIQSVEYISAFPAYEHIMAWINALEPMSNLKEISFQTIPIQDLDPDPYQRDSANFWLLENNRDTVYQAIFTKFVKVPKTQHHLNNEVPFRHLQLLQCTDLHDVESVSAWRRTAREAEEYGWIWKQSEDGLGQVHTPMSGETLIKEHPI